MIQVTMVAKGYIGLHLCIIGQQGVISAAAIGQYQPSALTYWQRRLIMLSFTSVWCKVNIAESSLWVRPHPAVPLNQPIQHAHCMQSNNTIAIVQIWLWWARIGCGDGFHGRSFVFFELVLEVLCRSLSRNGSNFSVIWCPNDRNWRH